VTKKWLRKYVIWQPSLLPYFIRYLRVMSWLDSKAEAIISFKTNTVIGKVVTVFFLLVYTNPW